jgi:hypothetical protein
VSIHLRGLHPQVRERAELALSWAKYYGLTPTITSGYRSWAEQERLYKAYVEALAKGTAKYPANRPGDSAHNFGFAWDSVVPDHQQWTWDYLRRYAGFEVLDHDNIHAQVPNWRAYTSNQLRRG